MFKIFQEYKSISWLLAQEKYIDFSPNYQRMGRVWNKEQKQLLIDSVINGFDIPKIYFQFMPQNNNTLCYNYAVIDGKQRLEAIFDFLKNELALSDPFVFINDADKKYSNIAGKTFFEIDNVAPSIISRILEYELCIVFMDTDSPDIINETFIRLNSGVAVNTAEKRNASGGNLAQQMKTLYMTSPFFTDKIRMTNARYAHFDLALKFLMIEMGYEDLGKKTVDRFVSSEKDFDIECQQALERVKSKINCFINEFDDKDKLLSKKSLIVTLYSIVDEIPVGKLKKFIKYFELSREIAMGREDKINSDPKMIEFTRLLQQGADKKFSLDGRREIMLEYLHIFLTIE
ncbi:MAG: DUF262 domain-containing protein [Ruminococcaceae bacterium]|nr:DUF262 domain-containing protein [Oscillospiraceae bacterium]